MAYKFTCDLSYFVDFPDAAKKCPKSRLITQPNLGLLETAFSDTTDPPSTSWDRFRTRIEELNHAGPPSVSFKLVYVVRHGLGVHNVVEAKVGRRAWDEYWSHLEGDGEISWVDAKLTEDGASKMRAVGAQWAEWTKTQCLPVPGTIYTSPLARCLETTKLVFSNVMGENGRNLAPVVKELLRERLTSHTCDKRSTRSWISQHYPGFILEPGFEEADILWQADRVETDWEHRARTQRVFEDIFDHAKSPIIALVTHSYTVSAILEVVGAPHFRVSEGTVFPLLVRAEKKDVVAGNRS
ncbi:histidine phosphatase superfamily [Podospora aff. communis PSN243]|uniref:Histidine phosphatase superfamily n=1 Tax=Podospora aff. communis PSN243 TaxID=3040156 RepID=A0AAV9GFK8_9PEZI|nr:histidine phosphatase superfamily [Podospora aff. communis PSN243]